jgi:hypothetical protein
MDKRELINNLKQEWKRMWRERIEDEVKAEGIASNDYEKLFIERGIVLYATRYCTPPDFREVVKNYIEPESIEKNMPNPVEGGIRKFIREYIINQKKLKSRKREETKIGLAQLKKQQQLKHGGYGWLHNPRLKVR